MKKLLLAIMVLPFTFAACKKKDEKKEPTKSEILKTGQWKVSEVYIDKDGELILDYYSQMDECSKDNYYTFNTNNTITSNEGATKCDPAIDQETTDGKWALSNNDQTFTITDSKILPIDGEQSMKVASIETSTIKLTKDTTIVYPGFGTLSGTIHATFTKK